MKTTSVPPLKSPFKDNILALLAPLNLYNLSPESNVYKEILVYSHALESVLGSLDNLLNESFVQTAKDEGLHLREQLLDLSSDLSVSIDDRRNQILHALAIHPKNFNTLGIINSLKSIGLDASISEDPKDESLTISTKIPPSYSERLSKIKSDIFKMLPAHLEILLNLGTSATWCNIENTLNSGISEKQNISWDELEANL